MTLVDLFRRTLSRALNAIEKTFSVLKYRRFIFQFLLLFLKMIATFVSAVSVKSSMNFRAFFFFFSVSFGAGQHFGNIAGVNFYNLFVVNSRTIKQLALYALVKKVFFFLET